MAKHTMGRHRRPDNAPITLGWLLSNSIPEPNSGCWLWEMGTNSKGYGQFSPTRGECVKAHRAVYEFMIGPVPEGMHIDHLCRNPGCVNPYHLEPVTPQENQRRGKTVALFCEPTHCKKGHAFGDGNPYGTTVGKYEKPRGQCSVCLTAIRKKWNDITNAKMALRKRIADPLFGTPEKKALGRRKAWETRRARQPEKASAPQITG